MMRKQFEAYFKARYPKAYMERNTAPNGSYMAFDTQRAWEVWKASREILWPWQTFAEGEPAPGQSVWIRPAEWPTSIHIVYYDPEVKWMAEDLWMSAPEILDLQERCVAVN